jgi:U5 small nuclear ribonucleoprotein component
LLLLLSANALWPQVYTDFHQQAGLSAKDLSLRLWGDAWLDPATRTFRKAPPPAASGHALAPPRTFVQYVLEPLYKLYAACLSEEPEALSRTLRDLGTVALSKPEVTREPTRLVPLLLPMGSFGCMFSPPHPS